MFSQKTSNKAIGETSSKDSQEISYNVRTGANDTQQSKMRNSQLPMNPTKKEYLKAKLFSMLNPKQVQRALFFH